VPDRDLGALYAARVAEQDRDQPGYAAAWDGLARLMLRHGGSHVVPPLQPDPLLDILVAEATEWDGPSRRVRGDASDCHRNVAHLWRSGDAVAIGTGYALSGDELWREHSWGFGAGGELLETTVARVRYVGIRLDGDRAAWFADWVDPPA
jgi:hypothetical protein